MAEYTSNIPIIDIVKERKQIKILQSDSVIKIK